MRNMRMTDKSNMRMTDMRMTDLLEAGGVEEGVAGGAHWLREARAVVAVAGAASVRGGEGALPPPGVAVRGARGPLLPLPHHLTVPASCWLLGHKLWLLIGCCSTISELLIGC